MTTRVTTNEIQVLRRSWLDLDPKVRNALNVWMLTLLLAILGVAMKSVTFADALYLLIPVTLAVTTAYITTSKHKDLILELAHDAEALTPALPSRVAGPAHAALVAVTDAAESDPQPAPPEVPDVTQTQIIPSTADRFLTSLPSYADSH